MQNDRRRSRLWAISAMAGLVVLSGCGTTAKSAAAPNHPKSTPVKSTATAHHAAPIKIGVMTNDTGPYAPLGTEVRNAVQMVFSAANKAGGVDGHPIDPIFLDGQTNPNLAVTQAKQLAADHVAAVVGLEFGTAAHAAAPILERAKIPTLTNTADETIAVPVNPWIFDVSTVTKIQDQRDLSYLACKGITKIASLHDTEALGVEGNHDLQAMAAHYHVKVVSNQSYNLTAKNLVNQLTAIGRTPAQAIVYWGVGTAPAIVAKEHYDLNMKIPLIGSAANADPTFLKEVGKEANGMLDSSTAAVLLQHLPHFVARKAALLAFAKAYQQKFHQPFGELAGLGHDAAAMLVHVMKAGALTPTAIQAKLNHLTYAGFQGAWHFTPTQHVGLQLKDVVMARIVHGVAVPTKCQ